MMLDGMQVVVEPMLAGSKRGIVKDGRVHVSPAYYDLLKNAKTQSELVALMKSLTVLNLDPPRHDAQWHVDTAQILGAMLDNARKVKS